MQFSANLKRRNSYKDSMQLVKVTEFRQASAGVRRSPAPNAQGNSRLRDKLVYAAYDVPVQFSTRPIAGDRRWPVLGVLSGPEVDALKLIETASSNT
jgi:hypothetical protein